MAAIRPWGPIDWLFPKLGIKNWDLISCASFEERSTALGNWFAASQMPAEKILIFRIKDPKNRFTEEIERLSDVNERHLRKIFPTAIVHVSDLLAHTSVWNSVLSRELPDTGSVLLDISTLPKRVFLFLVKRLLAREGVKNLVVCYSRPKTYPEGPITQDSNPVEAIPGFVRISDGAATCLVVGVGYVAFDINQLIEQVQAVNLHFLFPFPPGSPAFRRNWGLIRQLMPEAPIPLEIQRIHAMDMFAALDWLKQIGADANGQLDMLALGPKPHSLAMGLAALAVGETSQVMYSQPKIYHPNYSMGLATDASGRQEIYAYCLRRNGINYV